MALKLKRQAPETVPTPAGPYVAFFIDPDGNPALKNNAGAVAPAVDVSGSPLTLLEQGSAPSATVDAVKLYAKQVSGVTEFFARDEAGNEVQITSGGALTPSVPLAPVIDWKGGTPGNPYVVGDTVNLAFGTISMVLIENPDTITLQLPQITAASAGQRVHIRNLTNKKTTIPGAMNILPNAADFIESYAMGEGVTDSLTDTVASSHMELESDGVGRWNFVGAGHSGAWYPIP